MNLYTLTASVQHYVLGAEGGPTFEEDGAVDGLESRFHAAGDDAARALALNELAFWRRENGSSDVFNPALYEGRRRVELGSRRSA